MTVDAAPVTEIGYAHGGTGGYGGTGGWWPLGWDEETTPELRWPASVSVFDAMRSQDAQVASVLRAVTLPVRRTTWRLDGSGCREEVTRHVSQDLGLPVVGFPPNVATRTRGRFSWDEHLYHALLMLVFGHAYFEQQYRIDTAGLAHLRRLGYRPPRTLSAVTVASDGGLVSIVQHPRPGSGVKAKPIPVDRLVAYVNDREGGNWLGRSLLRPAYKFWRLKDPTLRVQAQTNERNGMGVPLYEGSETEKTRDDLVEGAKLATSWRSGSQAGAAIPHGANLTLKGVEGELPDAMPAIRYYDEQIARAVLAHFLNLDTKGGSYALASVQAETFIQSLQSLAQSVADTTSQHVVEDLVDLNWGSEEPAPRVVFEEIGAKQAATADSIKKLLDSGALFADRELEESLRQQYGLPPKTQPAAQPPAQT